MTGYLIKRASCDGSTQIKFHKLDIIVNNKQDLYSAICFAPGWFSDGTV